MANYDERLLLIEVDGLYQQGVMQTNHATFKVPYCSLARILKLIKLKGGKIVRIHPLASSLTPETIEPPSPKAVEPPSLKIAESPSLKPVEPPSLKIAESPSLKPVEPPSLKIAESPSLKPVEPPSSKTAESPPPLMVESKVARLFKLPGLLRRLLGNT